MITFLIKSTVREIVFKLISKLFEGDYHGQLLYYIIYLKLTGVQHKV